MELHTVLELEYCANDLTTEYILQLQDVGKVNATKIHYIHRHAFRQSRHPHGKLVSCFSCKRVKFLDIGLGPSRDTVTIK